MLLGVQSAVRGLVRVLAERYAENYEAYPQIIATGGGRNVDIQLLRGADAERRRHDVHGDQSEPHRDADHHWDQHHRTCKWHLGPGFSV